MEFPVAEVQQDNKGMHRSTTKFTEQSYERRPHQARNQLDSLRNDSKRPDGAPWLRAWNVAVVDTLADSHIHDTSSQAGETANKAAANKTTKYSKLTVTHILAPIAMETAGHLNNLAIETIEEIGQKNFSHHQRTIGNIISVSENLHGHSEGMQCT